MQYTSRIILDNKMQMLEPMIYQNICPIENWQTKELIYIEPLKYAPVDDWTDIAMGDHWRAMHDHTRLFRTRVTLPDFGDHQPLLVLDLGGEGLVRINGEIISGVTSYVGGSFLAQRQRSRVYIPEKYRPGDVLEIEVECCLNFLEFTYTVTLKDQEPFAEYTLRNAFFAYADADLEKYVFDLRNTVEAMDTFANPLDTLQNSNARILDPTVQKIMKSLNSDSFLHKRLFAAAMDSVSLLDMEFGYERLRASLPAASAALQNALDSIPHKATAMVKFVGQAHIDTAWLWPLKETVRKCGKTFSNTIALMEKYPEYIFAFSQPQLFAYTEEFYPELFEKIKQRVADGRIELVGNAWVEMDTNVPSGESLVRQLLYGRQYYLDKFGKDSRVFWMPDVFGYSWALPQIMKRSGVDYFFTSKLVNNDTNNFPHSLFMWQGVDGTKILSYLQRLNYNGTLDAGTISDIYSLFDQKDVCDEVLMTIGYGDGGGGPSYQMLENAQRLKDFPGLPQSEFATSESFFTDAEKAQNDLPVWNDEMYYEFHRGTYTSQADVKKNNRKAELLLRRTEIACAMAHVRLGREYPARVLGNIWKKILTNQFHDILPGSSIHQVYVDCAQSYAEALHDAEALFNDAMAALNAGLGLKDDQIAVWNFLSWPVTETVSVDPAAEGLIDEEGVYLAADDGVFEAKNIPPMGVKIYTVAPRGYGEKAHLRMTLDEYGRFKPLYNTARGVSASPTHMENDHLRVELDENGNIVSLYDKHAGREVLEAGKPSNLLTVFEDIPHRESAWNIDIEYMNHAWPLTEAESVTLIEHSNTRAVIRTVRKFNLSTITQDIILTRNARRVDFATHVNWQETQRMLKAAFYADILSQKATYEIQFGAIERPTHWNTSYDKARFEVCGHKWADLSEGLYGVSLINDCKYGYDIKDNCLRLTLLRAPTYPDPVADKGEHTFTYSIFPHEGDWRVGGAVHEAYQVNVPPVCCTGTANAVGARSFSFASADRANVIIDSIKGAEDGDGLILRVYESQGARCRTRIALGFDAKDIVECNLMEVCERDIPTDGDGFAFTIKPYEIKTFRIRKA